MYGIDNRQAEPILEEDTVYIEERRSSKPRHKLNKVKRKRKKFHFEMLKLKNK